jgi:hypothetical protein
MDYAVLDIETIPDQALPEACIPKFDESEVKLGNLKDQLKIREKIEQARVGWEEDLGKKMSFDRDLCQLCCAVCHDSRSDTFTTYPATTPEMELDALVGVWGWIAERYHRHIPLVTFNGITFDLPILQRRAMIHDVSVAPGMYQDLTKRQEYNTAHFDLMQLLAGRNPFSGKIEAKGLNAYLSRFGLGAKTEGWDGSMVYPAWKEGRMEEILSYCRQDVEMTARLFERVRPWVIVPKKNPNTMQSAA